jgi:hypothetical protein
LFFNKTVSAHLNWFQGNVINGVEQPAFLQLRADKFSETIFEATDEWDTAVVGDAAIQEERRKLLVIHSSGYTFAGVRFS